MACMRHGRRYSGITARRGYALVCKRRVVERMNQKMRHARMLGILRVELFQYRRGLALVGVVKISLRRSRLQRQRVIHPRFVVVGVANRDLLHRLLVGGQARNDIELVVIAIVSADGIDPVALALGLRAECARLVDRLGARLRLFQGGRAAQRIAHLIDRHAPIRHCAGGVLLQDRLENLAGVTEPIRVQHRDAALELGLHFGAARRGEGYVAKVIALMGENGGG